MEVKEKLEKFEDIIKKTEEKQPKEKNNENTKSKIQVTKLTLCSIIIILLLIIYILCYRMGKIGYNYLSIWDINKNNSIVIKSRDLQLTTNTQLDIFKDEKYGGRKAIAPMSKGTFKFSIRNDTNEDVIYNIKFVDKMNNFVNMKYKLKLDNIYIKGNKDEYITIQDLDAENIIIPKDSTSIYTLEWFWESDDEKDTYIGTRSERQYYSLTLYVHSQAYQV